MGLPVRFAAPDPQRQGRGRVNFGNAGALNVRRLVAGEHPNEWLNHWTNLHPHELLNNTRMTTNKPISTRVCLPTVLCELRRRNPRFSYHLCEAE